MMRKIPPGLPSMTELAPQERARFLEQHGDVLWAFWRQAFLEAFDAQPRFIAHEHMPRRDRDPMTSAEELAEKLIDRLRRPDISLQFARDWTDVRTWYRWLVGSTVARLISKDADRLPGRGWALPDWVQSLVEGWKRVVDVVRDRTGIASFEADWLYATVRARQRIAKSLRRAGDEASWSESRARLLLSEAAGLQMQKVARSRRGASAAFRFDLEHLAAGLPQFAALHEVYVGPVRSEEEAVPQPLLPVNGRVVAEFLCFARAVFDAVERRRRDREASEAMRIEAEVLSVALNRSSTRLLPPSFRSQVESAWPGVEAEEQSK